jgi:hypothetical protein
VSPLYGCSESGDSELQVGIPVGILRQHADLYFIAEFIVDLYFSAGIPSVLDELEACFSAVVVGVLGCVFVNIGEKARDLKSKANVSARVTIRGDARNDARKKLCQFVSSCLLRSERLGYTFKTDGLFFSWTNSTADRG